MNIHKHISRWVHSPYIDLALSTHTIRLTEWDRPKGAAGERRWVRTLLLSKFEAASENLYTLLKKKPSEDDPTVQEEAILWQTKDLEEALEFLAGLTMQERSL